MFLVAICHFLMPGMARQIESLAAAHVSKLGTIVLWMSTQLNTFYYGCFYVSLFYFLLFEFIPDEMQTVNMIQQMYRVLGVGSRLAVGVLGVCSCIVVGAFAERALVGLLS